MAQSEISSAGEFTALQHMEQPEYAHSKYAVPCKQDRNY